jgi:hypothetical protein
VESKIAVGEACGVRPPSQPNITIGAHRVSSRARKEAWAENRKGIPPTRAPSLQAKALRIVTRPQLRNDDDEPAAAVDCRSQCPSRRIDVPVLKVEKEVWIARGIGFHYRQELPALVHSPEADFAFICCRLVQWSE